MTWPNWTSTVKGQEPRPSCLDDDNDVDCHANWERNRWNVERNEVEGESRGEEQEDCEFGHEHNDKDDEDGVYHKLSQR